MYSCAFSTNRIFQHLHLHLCGLCPKQTSLKGMVAKKQHRNGKSLVEETFVEHISVILRRVSCDTVLLEAQFYYLLYLKFRYQKI